MTSKVPKLTSGCVGHFKLRLRLTFSFVHQLIQWTMYICFKKLHLTSKVPKLPQVVLVLWIKVETYFFPFQQLIHFTTFISKKKTCTWPINGLLKSQNWPQDVFGTLNKVRDLLFPLFPQLSIELHLVIKKNALDLSIISKLSLNDL